MEEKKFDSAEKILEALAKEKIRPERMYLAFIDSIHNCLSNHAEKINGAPAEEFFIQGLIAITGDVESFQVALNYFIDMKY